MANKKPKQEKTPRFEVKKRQPKEKPDFFQNIPSMKHPLAELLNFPIAPLPDLDSQTISDEISKVNNSGYPNLQNLDIQSETTSYPNNQEQDIQVKNVGYPNINNLDIQHQNTGDPKNSKRDIQSQNTGNPNDSTLDSKIAKTEQRISKSEQILDSKIAKSEKSDSQNKEEKGKWEKYDNKRKSKGIFLRTSDEITKQFKQFCIANDWDFSQGTEIAWHKLMSDLDSQKQGSLDSLIAQDDRRLKMLYKTKPLIINLYLAYNAIFNEFASGKTNWKPRWTPRDDEAAQKFNDSDIALIELGIIQTQMNKGIGQGRIQTFKYYTDEIENFLQAEINPETAKTILEVNRKMWKNQLGREIDLSFLNSKKD